MKTLRETLISELGMGMSSDEPITVVDRRNTVDDSVKICSLDGRGVVEIPSEVDSASSDAVLGNISTEVESIFFEAVNASIELKMASVDVENTSTEVEMKAGEDGAGDGEKILIERASSCEDIGMSLLLEDMCKTELESMDTSIVDVGNEIRKDDGSIEVNLKLSFGIIVNVVCECKSVGITMLEEGSDGLVEGFKEKLFVWITVL